MGNTIKSLSAVIATGLELIRKDDLFYTVDGNGNTSEMTDASMAID